MHLFPCTTLRTTSGHPQHRIHHPPLPQQASAASLQSSVPARKVPVPRFIVREKLLLSARGRTGTHFLDEDLEHRSAICYVTAEDFAARVRIARELLRLREVDAVVAHGETRTIEVGRLRATNVHHHAPPVAIRAMYDLVLVKKT